MRAQVAYLQVRGIEHADGNGLVFLVVGYAGATYDERVDTQVEWGMTGGIFRCQRVEYKLKIGLAALVLLI